jgi:hypothetical protein
MSREQKMKVVRSSVVCFVTGRKESSRKGRWEKQPFTLRVSVFVGARGLCLWPKIFLNQPAASLSADLDKPGHAHSLSFPSSHSCNLSYFDHLYLYSCNSHIDHSDNTRHEPAASLTEIILVFSFVAAADSCLHVKVAYAEAPVFPRPSLEL